MISPNLVWSNLCVTRNTPSIYFHCFVVRYRLNLLGYNPNNSYRITSNRLHSTQSNTIHIFDTSFISLLSCNLAKNFLRALTLPAARGQYCYFHEVKISAFSFWQLSWLPFYRNTQNTWECIHNKGLFLSSGELLKKVIVMPRLLYCIKQIFNSGMEDIALMLILVILCQN